MYCQVELVLALRRPPNVGIAVGQSDSVGFHEVGTVCPWNDEIMVSQQTGEHELT